MGDFCGLTFQKKTNKPKTAATVALELLFTEIILALLLNTEMLQVYVLDLRSLWGIRPIQHSALIASASLCCALVIHRNFVTD